MIYALILAIQLDTLPPKELMPVAWQIIRPEYIYSLNHNYNGRTKIMDTIRTTTVVPQNDNVKKRFRNHYRNGKGY